MQRERRRFCRIDFHCSRRNPRDFRLPSKYSRHCEIHSLQPPLNWLNETRRTEMKHFGSLESVVYSPKLEGTERKYRKCINLHLSMKNCRHIKLLQKEKRKIVQQLSALTALRQFLSNAFLLRHVASERARILFVKCQKGKRETSNDFLRD